CCTYGPRWRPGVSSRRLGNYSRKNRLYRAFRELGRAIKVRAARQPGRRTGPARRSPGAHCVAALGRLKDWLHAADAP
ncbi:MAG: transposase, partial [Actinobacteria bacterium]|nr:transposase [Actinomycetota bacterium]